MQNKHTKKSRIFAKKHLNNIAMKKKITLLLSLLFGLSMLMQSQNLVFFDLNNDIVSGDTVYASADTSNFEVAKELRIGNLSSQSIDVKVRKYETNMLTGTSSTFCWAGMCYPPSNNESNFSQTIAANDTTSGADNFSGHYDHSGIIGSSTISYTAFNIADPNDSVMVTIVFTATSVGVNNIENNISAKLYPNPAKNYTYLEYNNQKTDIKIEIYDILGNKIKEIIPESGNNKTRINTSEIATGTYIYRIISDKKAIKTNKLIIN